MKSTDWSKYILSHRGIKSLIFDKQKDQVKKEKANRLLTTSTINFKSSLEARHEFLGFSEDIKIEPDAKDVKDKVSSLLNQVLNVY